MSIEIFSEVEVELWIKQAPTSSSTISPQPRYQGYGYVQEDGGIVRWQAAAPNLPASVRGKPFWTSHLVTFNNKPNENREWFFNCLENAPTISESLASLTSGSTDFGSISVSLADPDVRRFFTQDFAQISTQNPIKIYREICGESTLVWRGYLEGVGFSRDRKTSVSVRPVTKRFDQAANFGFTSKTQRWIDNGFNIPIVAARVIPWSVQSNEHSVVGAEPWNQLVRGSAYSSSDDLYGRREGRDRDGDTANLVHDYGYRMYAVLQGEELFGLRKLRDYIFSQRQNLPGIVVEDRKNEQARRIGFAEGCLDIVSTANPENLRNHFEHKRPQYVTFTPEDLTPSVISLNSNGRMDFERGIFFHPSEDADVSTAFDPNETNYQIAPIPQGANTINNLNPISSCHLEKFFLGVEGFGEITNLSPTEIITNPNKFKIPLSGYRDGMLNPLENKYVTEIFYDIPNIAQRFFPERFLLSLKGFDRTTLFPSLRLGDSYCNWTHVPTLVQSITSDSNRDGYLPYPPVSSERFVQPIIKYMRWNGSNYEETSKGAHPLDSFYRWTLQSRQSRASESVYLRALIITPHATSLVYIDPLSGGTHIEDESWQADFYGSNRGNNIREDGADELTGGLIDYPVQVPGQMFRSNRYTFTQWSTFVLIQGGSSGKQSQETEFRNFVALSSIESEDAYYINPNGTNSSARNSWLYNGRIAVGMARSKDMYITTPEIDRYENIDVRALMMRNSEIQVEVKHQSGASTNLRVMPALPKSNMLNHNYPNITTEKASRGGGAYYISAQYDLLDEVGYWDSHIELNPTAASGLPEGRYFKGYYHHDQSGDDQGIAPLTFIKAVCRAAGFETSFDHNQVNGQTPRSEMTDRNPMQLIENSSKTYSSLIDRLLPGLGKALRLNHTSNEMEFIDWTTIGDEDRRTIVARFDEDCMIYSGSSHSASSRASSFIFENPDMIRGTNTLDEFSDDDFRLAKYTSFQATPFLQGRTVTVPTATWWKDPIVGINWYERLAIILTTRIDILEFAVPTEILTTFGPLGTVKVGSWVQVTNKSVPDETVQVFVTETHASEAQTQFRGYSFASIPAVANVSVSRRSVSSVVEGGTARFWIEAMPAVEAPLTVTVEVSEVGKFAQTSDLGRRTITIPAGQSRVSLDVRTLSDDRREPSGSVTARIIQEKGYFVVSPSRATVPVLDDGTAPPRGQLQTSETINLGSSRPYEGIAASSNFYYLVNTNQDAIDVFTTTGTRQTRSQVRLRGVDGIQNVFLARSSNRFYIAYEEDNYIFDHSGRRIQSEETDIARVDGLPLPDSVGIAQTSNGYAFLLAQSTGSFGSPVKYEIRFVVGGTEQVSQRIELGTLPAEIFRPFFSGLSIFDNDEGQTRYAVVYASSGRDREYQLRFFDATGQEQTSERINLFSNSARGGVLDISVEANRFLVLARQSSVRRIYKFAR